jgi:hypothetical protein
VSIALYPRWVSLFLLHGVGLPDPHKVLKGSGKQVRHVVLKNAETLDEEPVQTLIGLAVERAGNPLDAARPNQMVIKSVSAKQRPRRPK